MSRVPTRFQVAAYYAATLSLALAVTVLPGLIHPQAADAQRLKRPGANRGTNNGMNRGINNGGIPQNNTSRQPANPPRNNQVTTNRNPQIPSTGRNAAGNQSGTGTVQHESRSTIIRPGSPVGPLGQGGGFGSQPAQVVIRNSYPYVRYQPLYPVSRTVVTYFPSGNVYYPNYFIAYRPGVSIASPYGYYSTFPTYIDAAAGINEAPQQQNAYVPSPIYKEGVYQSAKGDDTEPFYLITPHPGKAACANELDASTLDPQLLAAVSDINTAWKNRDIVLLAKHIHRSTNVAIFLKGGYFYSLRGDNYLNITRDAFTNVPTVSFELDRVQGKGKGLYTVSGVHVFTDKTGTEQKVMVSYVLDKIDGYYYITQAGTAPEKLGN